MSTEFFHEETPKEKIERYREDLKRFQKLRASVQQRYAEVADMRKLEPQIAKLLDTYVTSDSVELLTPEPVDILNTAAMEAALASLGTPAAKADTIAHATARTIEARMDEDPALYREFSKLLQATIQAFREQMLTDLEYLRQVRSLRDRVVARADDDVPPRLADNDVAQAYYRVVNERYDQIAPDPSDHELAVEIALLLDAALRAGAKVVDWRQKPDVQNKCRAEIDDGLFALAQQGKLTLNWEALDEIVVEAERIAKSRLP